MLKVDIEGSEYGVIGDPAFSELTKAVSSSASSSMNPSLRSEWRRRFGSLDSRLLWLRMRVAKYRDQRGEFTFVNRSHVRLRRPPPTNGSQQPRILFVGSLPEPTTGQSLACQVLLEDLRLRYNVTVVDLVKSTLDKGVGSATRLVEVFKIVLQTARGARHADVIYITIAESVLGNMRDLLLYVASIGKLKTTVVHLHGGAGMRELMSDQHRILRRINAMVLRRLGAVIVLGERHIPLFEPFVDQARLVVVANFALDDVFVEERDIRAKFETVEPLRVLFLSNLIAGKGWQELLAAYEQLSPSERELIELDFAGAIAEDDDKGTFLERLDRLPQAHYHGSVRGETKAALLSEAHVFCLPTFYAFEGQPISILEAYASGCVVVTTDHSGIFDVFKPGLNGFEVTPKSIESLRNALMALLGCTDLAQIGLHNNRQAWSQFRAEAYCANVSRVIEMVLEPQDCPTAQSSLNRAHSLTEKSPKRFGW